MKSFFLLLLLPVAGLHAQSLNQITLKECRELAVQHYPMAAQQPLFKKIMQLDVQNLNHNWLPHLSLNAQATYQSDVTSIPIKLPQFPIPELSKDQYRAVVDLQQTIYDGGSISRQVQVRKASEAVEQQQVQVQLYQVKQKTDDIYLNILFINDQLELNELLKTAIRTQMNKVAAMVKNGVSLSTNYDELKAELLNAYQQETELQSNRRGYLNMLSILINQPLSDSAILERPAVSDDISGSEPIHRPELKLYAAQKNLLMQQSSLVSTQNIPHVSFFVEGGYGKPGLNMLEDQFKFFYLTGIQLSMPIWDWGKSLREKNSLVAQQSLTDLQQKTFLQTTSMQLTQQQQDMVKYKSLIATDQELVDLRQRIVSNAASQLQNGVITANDYLIDLNAENQALLNKKLHQLQLLMAQLNYQTTLGN